MQNAPLFLCLYIKKRVKRAKISGQTFLTIPWILRQSDILKNLYATRVFHFCLSSWFHGCNEHLKGFNSIKGNKKSLIRQGFSNLMLLYGTSVGSTWGYVVPTKVQSPQDVAWEYRFFDKFQNQAHGKSNKLQLTNPGCALVISRQHSSMQAPLCLESDFLHG